MTVIRLASETVCLSKDDVANPGITDGRTSVLKVPLAIYFLYKILAAFENNLNKGKITV